MNNESLTTCGGLDCNICSLLATVSKTISYLLIISAALAVFLVVISGFLYIGSFGGKFLLEKAKRYFRLVVLGFFIILVSWITINTILWLSGFGGGKWWNFECDSGTRNGLAEVKISEIAYAVKNGGKLSGIIPSGTKHSDLEDLYNDLPENNTINLVVLENGEINPWAVFERNKDGLSIIYVDARKIKDLAPGGFSGDEKTLTDNSSLDPTASNSGLQAMANSIKSLVFDFVAGRKDQGVIVMEKPKNFQLEPSNIPTKMSKDMKNDFALANNCLDSRGNWYRFLDKQTNKFSDSCACPDNKKPNDYGKCD